MKNKNPSGHIKITSARGLPGIRLISADEGVEIEVIKQTHGAATFEIRQYDDEKKSESLIIRLTKAKVAAMVELLDRKLQMVPDIIIKEVPVAITSKKKEINKKCS